MIHKLTHVKSSNGSNYLGIKYNESLVEDYLMKLMEHIDDDQYFEVLTSNQQRRDHNSFHTTVLNVMEYNKSIKKLGMDLFMKKLNGAFSIDVEDIELVGVGTAEGKGNKTFFIVVKSDMLNEVRRSFGFDEKDLHITIGFDKKDVFGVPKDETSLI